MPNASSLLGPLLIGVFFNTILYGVCVVQAFIYYRTYKKDATWIRYFILYLFIMETLNTGFNIGMMYEPLIINFGEMKSLIVSPKMLVADGLMTSLISTSAQFFIAWRIKVISQSLVMPFVIGFFGICALTGGIALSVCVALMPNYRSFHQFEGAVITWLVASAVADLLITFTLSWSLYKRKTGIKATDDKVSQLIRVTVHTGLLTAVLAVSDLVVFLVVPNTTLNFIWDLPLSKIYTNSLLSTLNARAAWNGLHITSAVAAQINNQNVLFGHEDMSKLKSGNRNYIDTEVNNPTNDTETSSDPRFSQYPISLSELGKSTSDKPISKSQTKNEDDKQILLNSQ